MDNQLLYTNECIDKIFKKYSDMVFKLALSQTKNYDNAQDIFQEVFLRFIQEEKAFQNEEHIKAWLLRVTINCSRKLWNSSWFRRSIPLDESKHITFETQEERDVYYSVMKLSLKYRTVIQLYYYEDMSIEQISKILNIKSSTIKSQLRRAREILKENLKGDYSYV